METTPNPYRDLPANITPTEFEEFCLNTLSAYAKKEALQDFVIKHNQKIDAADSTYQIDVLAEYTALGCKNTVIVECKKYTRSIERSVVAELYAKLQSIGAQKGILMSTSGFQSDAVKFAGAHGIALWQVCDCTIKHYSAAANREIEPYMLFQLEMEKHLPRYIMMEWDCEADYPYHELYPTKEMYDDARRSVIEAHRIRREKDA